MPKSDPDIWVMGAGRHAGRKRGGRAVSILLVTTLVLAGLAGGAAYAGYRYDRNRIDRILPGIRIAGVDVGDMTRHEAEVALRPAPRRGVPRLRRRRAGAPALEGGRGPCRQGSDGVPDGRPDRWSLGRRSSHAAGQALRARRPPRDDDHRAAAPEPPVCLRR